MPEGHSVHRIARQFDRNFVGRTVGAVSPQGRFAEGASIIDGRTATAVRAVGKQMFLEFDDDLWLRVHLGMYGAWDFAGEILVDATIASANGRMGQTNQRGTVLGGASGQPILDAAGENSLIRSARRARARVRMSEQTKARRRGRRRARRAVGQVRLRLLTDPCRRPARPDRLRAADPAEVARVDRQARSRSARRRRPEAEERFTARRAHEADRRSACSSWTSPS